MNWYCWIFISINLVMVISYDNLSYRKVASQSTTAPSSGDAYVAGNAVDGDINTCMRTDVIGLNSPEETVWWKVDLGGVYNIYSVNILFKNYVGYGIHFRITLYGIAVDVKEMRQRGRFAGFSLFVSHSENIEVHSLCYKTGLELPPLNFTTTCDTSGRYITFYNERLRGVTYPSVYEVHHVFSELCEVTVKGCKRDGVYGISCDLPCPTNCQTNTCTILNGFCFECKPGWMGTKCTSKCAFGLYGVDCKQPCPGHCRDNITCNHLTGLCDGGCAAGWNGSLCNILCPDGLYGFYCTQRCSGNCKINASCNHITGVCDAGCAVGWNGSRCDGECSKCENALPDMTTPGMPSPSTEIISNLGSQLCAEDSRQWCIVGPVSLGLNILFTVGLLVLIWSVYTKKISMSVQTPPCLKSKLYVKTEVKTEDNAHYQEIGLSRRGNLYQNTTLQS